MTFFQSEPGETVQSLAQRAVEGATAAGHPCLARHNDRSAYVFPNDDRHRVINTLLGIAVSALDDQQVLSEAISLLRRLTTLLRDPDDPLRGTATLMHYSPAAQLRRQADDLEAREALLRELYTFLRKLP